MRHKYDSFQYWQGLIRKNRTIRGHMFMDELPTKDSVYIHTLIFSKGNGLRNIWSYFPNEMALVGYIQYSFLQEAFYTWINGKNDSISRIPLIPVEDIIKEGEKNKRITSKEASEMRRYLQMINKCWDLPRKRVFQEIKKFAREFNRTWYGDSSEFLYLKVFETPVEVGDFVVNSAFMTYSEEEFKSRTTKTINQWKEICSTADTEPLVGEVFREILLKYLTEII